MTLHQLIDYETLRVIWWLLLGVLLIGFAVMDGFDLGTQTLLPFVARTDIERRVVINAVGPVWEGNQVWFILGGGAIFAAWPALYALSFSGFYLAMFLVLMALILRPVAFKYRSKKEDPVWRARWDWALFIGSAVPALIFGVAVGNTLRGVPFHFTPDLRPIYEGTLFGLLNPAALYCGIVSVAMIVMHGAAWLTFKAEGTVSARAREIGAKAALATSALFAGGGVLVFPTSPVPAPLLSSSTEEIMAIREQTIGVTSISGFSGTPEVTLPVARVDGAPVGLSLLAAPGRDRALLAYAEAAAEALGIGETG